MPRFFFDINDGRNEPDEEGFECADLQTAVLHAKQALPDIAADEVPRDGERQAFTVLVSNEEGESVYLAAMTYTGTWLKR